VSERLLTAAEVAERLGFSAGWVLDHFEAGELPGFRLGRKGGPVRFRWSEIEEWLQTRRVGPIVGDGQLVERKG
jgi:excisionase family DNA binding protein